MARVRDPSYDFQMTMVTCSNDIQTPRCKAWWRHLSTVGLTSSKSLPACAVLNRGSFTVRTSVLQLRVLYKILLTHHGGSVADGPLHTILIVTRWVSGQSACSWRLEFFTWPEFETRHMIFKGPW